MFKIVHLHLCCIIRSRKGKVPKRINKAVRERLKREHLNELFIELADTLGKFRIFRSKIVCIDLNDQFA